MKHFSMMLFVFLILTSDICAQSNKKLESESKQVMMNATKFMVEDVSTNGGYVYRYLPDLSRRWGELEAYDSMIWLEGSSSTVGMGNLFLDAYHVTGDEYYYEAAEKVANALAWGQHESGGWHYFIDFNGESSIKEWYRTIGKNAWGFEEHNHYYGNATFDGLNTVRAAQFFLRLYIEKLDPTYKMVLDKTINFVLESQYPLGGWPQRYPLKFDFPHGELEDYTSFYTFNDDVISENINFLIQCYAALGESRFIDPIRRAMSFYTISQQANPQAGWSKQHNLTLEPAHARTYEPAAIYPDFTYVNAKLLLRFYELTGERKFIARVPDAIAFLESVGKMDSAGLIEYPLFIEIGTNKALYPHRKGTGVEDGKYWLDYDPTNTIQHYKGRPIDIDLLKAEYNRLNALSPELASKDSPLKPANRPRSGLVFRRSYLKRGELPDKKTTPSEVRGILKSIDQNGRWLVQNQPYSLPYNISADGKETNTARRSNLIGETILDTSGQKYISTGTYINNMKSLINFVKL